MFFCPEEEGRVKSLAEEKEDIQLTLGLLDSDNFLAPVSCKGRTPYL